MRWIARSRLNSAVSGTFGEDARFEFFGSAVNGFETSSSEAGREVTTNISHKSQGSGCLRGDEAL